MRRDHASAELVRAMLRTERRDPPESRPPAERPAPDGRRRRAPGRPGRPLPARGPRRQARDGGPSAGMITGPPRSASGPGPRVAGPTATPWPGSRPTIGAAGEVTHERRARSHARWTGSGRPGTSPPSTGRNGRARPGRVFWDYLKHPRRHWRPSGTRPSTAISARSSAAAAAAAGPSSRGLAFLESIGAIARTFIDGVRTIIVRPLAGEGKEEEAGRPASAPGPAGRPGPEPAAAAASRARLRPIRAQAGAAIAGGGFEEQRGRPPRRAQGDPRSVGPSPLALARARDQEEQDCPARSAWTGSPRPRPHSARRSWPSSRPAPHEGT